MKFVWLTVFCCLAAFARGQASLVDPTFEVGFGADGTVFDLALQNDGKILVGGSFNAISGQPRAKLARLLPNGHVDSSFSNAVTDGTVYALAQQSDGNLLVGGSFTELQGAACAGLGRLLTNGTFDSSFNAGTFSPYHGIPFKIATQPDGKILVSLYNGPSDEPQLVRLNTDGTRDDSFVETNVFQNYWIQSLLVRSNGSIFVGGGFNGVNDFASPGLVLLDSSGQVNTNFQSGLADGSDIYSIVPLTNGGFLIGGNLKHTNGSPDTVLERLTPGLAWDTNFVTSFFAIDDALSYIVSCFVQPDGKIVAGGHFYHVGGYWRRHIVRLDSNGKVDPCFDPGVGLGGFDAVYVIKPQPDGHTLVCGSFGIQGFVPNNIVRLLPQSDCDATRVYFGTDSGDTFVAGTTPPGGTNVLQVSTNLLDWIDLQQGTDSYILLPTGISTDYRGVFYRLKKTY